MTVTLDDGDVVFTVETPAEHAALSSLTGWDRLPTYRGGRPEYTGDEPDATSPLFGLAVTWFPSKGRLTIRPANAWWNDDE